MFILNLLRYLRGYVVFSAIGGSVERFFNLAARDGVPVWNTFRREDVFYGRTFAGSYTRLHRHARKSGVRLRVVKKYGAPFKRRKYRKRGGLLFGLGLFLAFIFLTSRFVWRVEVNGHEKVAESEIVASLEALGAKPGVLKASIDVRGAERRLLMAIDRLSWAALNISGSTIYVEVRERTPPPPVVNPSEPCNIVASHSGQILGMLVLDGQPVRNIGDAVQKGEIIVSGVTQTRLGQNSLRHARASVKAQVDHRIVVETGLDQLVYQETGEIATRNYLRVFDWDFPLFPPLRIPKPYHAEREYRPFSIFGRELYSGIFSERFHLMEEIPVTYSAFEAKTLALRELRAREKAELPDAEILRQNMFSRTDGITYTLIADYVCVMDIAAEKPIILQ